MSFVFDTGPFILLSALDRDVFVTPWQAVEDGLTTGSITSCALVFNELDGKSRDIRGWAANWRTAFHRPNLAEQTLVREILSKFPHLLKQSDLLSGRQVADPFVIARAATHGGSVVTGEKLKPNAQKIPNVCQHYGIEHCDLNGFFRKSGLTF